MFILLQRLLPKHFLSRLVGWVANSEIKLIKNTFIRVVIAKYGVNMSEAKETDLNYYKSFNHFFARELAPGKRPISGALCSPADGAVSAAGPIVGNQIFQAKGINYTLEKLLAREDTEKYQNGSFMTVYLAPKDYHRVHCPQNAKLHSLRYVPGKLFSVNKTTCDSVENLFADNERLVLEFETAKGKMSVVMVGALIVAAIQAAWETDKYKAKTFYQESFSPPKEFKQGQELGQFQMGSTAIIILEEKVDWLQENGSELRMGEAIVKSA